MKKLVYKSVFLSGYTLSFICIGIIRWSRLQNIWAPIMAILFITFIVCAVVSRILSKKLKEGVEKINLENPVYGENFKEFYSLIGHLKEQNKVINDQKEDLRLRKRQFAAITDNMSEGFLLVDYKMQVLSFNQSALKFLFNGSKVDTELKKSNCEPLVIKSIESALAGERTEMLLTKNETCTEIIASPVVSYGQVIGGVIIALDVTEKQQRENLRKEFSANVSHELKTPLTSITGFAELMRDGLVPQDKIKEFSGDIYNEGQRLLSLVNDIIRLSKLDEGVSMPESEAVNLYTLAEEVAYELNMVADKKQVEIVLSGENITVLGVKQILQEMLFNLCDNAIKYNKIGGKVQINVSKTAEGFPFVKVTDTGIGIPLSHQNRVFERFYRVDKSHSKEIGGTGLGLSIVKHAAAYHGAAITLKSEVDIGTEITITFKEDENDVL